MVRISKRVGHAVVIPVPAQGHINPMMHFSRWLQSNAGMSVTFVNTQYNHDRLIKSWQWHKEGNNGEAKMRMVAIPDGIPHDLPRSVNDIAMAVSLHMGAHFEALLQDLLQQDGGVTCIISDLYVPFVPDLAIKYGIPRIGFWTQSAASYACHLAAARGFAVPTDARNSRCKNIVDIPGVLPIQFDDIPTFLKSFDPNDLMFNGSICPFTRLHETSCILINSSTVLEHDCLCQIYEEETRIFTIGPILPNEYFHDPSLDTPIESIGTSLWEEDASCVAWLDSQATRSVLYISFGSIATLSREQMEEFSFGLESSHVPLLWVIRPNLIVGESSIFPKGFVERMGDRLYFVSWAPQLQVLSHNSIGGFLTHCGWNSTMESVVRQVPMLCWPYFADQPLDQRLIVDLWQVGLEFVANQDGVVTSEEVEVKVKALMYGEEGKHIRNRINKLGEDVRLSAREENGSSKLEFNHFIKLISQIRKQRN